MRLNIKIDRIELLLLQVRTIIAVQLQYHWLRYRQEYWLPGQSAHPQAAL